MTFTSRKSILGFASLLLFIFILIVHRAIPFLLTPDTNEAVWAMGFAQSLANGPLLSVHANDFGIPTPAAISFGLSGILPAAIFIRLGLEAADAYSAAAAIFLGLAMFSTYKLSRLFNAPVAISLIGSVLWLTMPIVWGHASYSMLSWGIALLPYYFLASFKLIDAKAFGRRIYLWNALNFLLACLVSVFMDGYTFTMFVVGTLILFIIHFLITPEKRTYLARAVAPTILSAFLLSYFLYTKYIGLRTFDSQPIEVFRAMGVDITFLAVPNQGMHWLLDYLGLSSPRNPENFYGDSSTWKTTFILPLFILSTALIWRFRKLMRFYSAVLILILFSFYMSLGPSLKFNSTVPEKVSNSEVVTVLDYTMPAEHAVVGTGSQWISEKLPAFDNMRAAYRWVALSAFGMWLLIMICSSFEKVHKRWIWFLGILLVITFNLPNLKTNWSKGVGAHSIFENLDRTLVSSLSKDIEKNEVVAFLPWNNDWVINYLAPKTGFKTYNIGGDKNIFIAKKNWPGAMVELDGRLLASDIDAAESLLISGKADVIAIPYFSTQRSDSIVSRTLENVSERERLRKSLMPFVESAVSSEYLDVVENEFFAIIRLKNEYDDSFSRKLLLQKETYGNGNIVNFSAEDSQSRYFLDSGWYAIESAGVWSTPQASLSLLVPDNCVVTACSVNLLFKVFGASEISPKQVIFSTVDVTSKFHSSHTFISEKSSTMSIPIFGENGSVVKISISTPDASSPHKLGTSSDKRDLGIHLTQLEFISLNN